MLRDYGLARWVSVNLGLCLQESISTCRFAQRVALIKNEAVLNEELDPTLVRRRPSTPLITCVRVGVSSGVRCLGLTFDPSVKQ